MPHPGRGRRRPSLPLRWRRYPQPVPALRGRDRAIVGAALALSVALGGCTGPAQRATPGSAIPAPSMSSLPPTPTQCSNQTVLAGWSTARLAAQLVVVPAPEADVAAAAAAVAQGAGGVVLFGSAAPADLGSQIRALDARAPESIHPLVMTDEEGGGVQRMANLVGSMPWARQMGSTMSPPTIQRLAEAVGQRLRALGVTMDLAPVLDVDGGNGPNTRDPDGARSFSADPAQAARDGIAFAAGLLAAGVIPVVKHFPGLGGASGNTDYGPAATRPYSSLLSTGLLPFEQAVAAGLPAVLVSNASVPGLTAGPASLSPAAIQGLLEGRLQFHGLVMTDSLSAPAITAVGLTVPQAAVRAVAAGADLVMFSSGQPGPVLPEIEAALARAEATGEISSARLIDAADQVLVAKGVSLCRPG